MLIKSFILLALLLATGECDYTVSFVCSYFSCPLQCTYCQTTDGGPFNKLTRCVTSCPTGSTFNISFSCLGCGSTCSYASQTAGFTPNYGCTSAVDKSWPFYKGQLDDLYNRYISSSVYYDWCANACSSPIPPGPSPSGLSGGIIAVIVIGVVAVVGILGFLVYKQIQRNKTRSQLTSDKDSNGLYASIKNSH